MSLLKGKCSDERYYDVSVIVAVHNSISWLDECFTSILEQDFSGKLQVSVYDDCSSDDSFMCIKSWEKRFMDKNIDYILDKSVHDHAKGPGHSKNKAITNSNGRFICIQDSDDFMSNSRLRIQYEEAVKHPNTIVGSRFDRIPIDSTQRFTKWANSLENPDQLYYQAFTSNGPTIIMPTWMFSRDIFDNIGGFDERGKGIPEDLLFFYKHLEKGGKLFRCPESLVTYRYHLNCYTLTVPEKIIWTLRVNYLQERILNNWISFTIWNAGKQGKRFYRSLSLDNQKKVVAFCDVDIKKINRSFYVYEDSKDSPKPKIPIIHFTKAKPPIIICIKLDLTNGEFETNLKSLNLREGVEWIHFN